MTTKWMKPSKLGNEKLPKVMIDTLEDNAHKQKPVGSFSTHKLSIETEEAQLESHSKSEIKTISDLMKQVSKKAMVKKLFTNPRH